MKDFGLFRAAACVNDVRLADIAHNCESICRLISAAEDENASLAVFPELCVTGFSCQDLFTQNILIENSEKGIKKIADFTRGKHVTAIIGAPMKISGRIVDCAFVLRNGNIMGIVPKMDPGCGTDAMMRRMFASSSRFSSADGITGRYVNDGKKHVLEGFGTEVRIAGQKCNVSPNLLFTIGKATIGIELQEDLMTPFQNSTMLASAGADIIANLTASSESMGKGARRRAAVTAQSERTSTAYIYCSAGNGESTTDNVYGGTALIAETGDLLEENESFSEGESIIFSDIDLEKISVTRQKKNAAEYPCVTATIELGEAAKTDFSKKLYREIDSTPFIPEVWNEYESCNEAFEIQVKGLVDRMKHIGCERLTIGVSGGLDSTMALLVAAGAMDRLGLPHSNILGVTMPGLGTSKRTKNNAVDLMEALGTSSKEISVVPAVEQHFKDIDHDPKVMDSTYENAQARERTQILMDMANQDNSIVVGTGDLSELALGWCTYNGDHMSMYAVNSSVPKTLLRHMVTRIAEEMGEEKPVRGDRTVSEILYDVAATPISPELKPVDENGEIAQKTEDLIGPYELHDFFIWNFFNYGYGPAKQVLYAEKAFEGTFDRETIIRWIKKFHWRFFSQQFKRSCMPDGPAVTSVSFSPRGSWMMPSDAKVDLWINELEEL